MRLSKCEFSESVPVSVVTLGVSIVSTVAVEVVTVVSWVPPVVTIHLVAIVPLVVGLSIGLRLSHNSGKSES